MDVIVAHSLEASAASAKSHNASTNLDPYGQLVERDAHDLRGLLVRQ